MDHTRSIIRSGSLLTLSVSAGSGVCVLKYLLGEVGKLYSRHFLLCVALVRDPSELITHPIPFRRNSLIINCFLHSLLNLDTPFTHPFLRKTHLPGRTDFWVPFFCTYTTSRTLTPSGHTYLVSLTLRIVNTCLL